MFEIRIHGRGGQGVVTAAELIALATFCDGKVSQAFPSFGVERQGAPIEAYVRISRHFIQRRWQVYKPDYIIVQDASLLKVIDVLRGAKKNTLVIINTTRAPQEILKEFPRFKKINLVTIPATEIALKVFKKPIINTVLLGAFAGATGILEFSSLKKAILERFPGTLGQKNVQALKAAFSHADPKSDYSFKE